MNFLRSKSGARATNRDPILDIIQSVAENDVTLIDVRDISEISQSGKAKGALHIPLMSIGVRADPCHSESHPALDVNKPVAIYCASGARSGIAAKTMTGLGFKSVTNIGGLATWLSAGGTLQD